MIYLLDVSSILALLWERHVHHERVTQWQIAADLSVCPITELGFVRISTQPALGATIKEAVKLLRDWRQAKKPQFVACDLEVLGMQQPAAGPRTTDFYLASLAEAHGMQLATLDGDIKHKAAFLIPELPA